MSDPNQAIAGAEPVSNISIEELIAQRMGEVPAEETETEGVEESEDVTEDDQPASPEGEESAEESEDFEDDEESESEEQAEIDLLSLTPEQIQDLAKKGKSRLLHRIGELTAQKKALEAQIESLPQARREVEQSEIPEQIRSLDSPEKLQEFYLEMQRTLETTEVILEDHEDYHLDDIINVSGKDYTKRELKKANRNAKDALTKFLPAQNAHIFRREQMKQASAQFEELARKEVPEIQDEESTVGKNFKALASDPLVSRVKREIPEIGVHIDYLLAHAARSIYGGKPRAVQAGAGNKVRVNPSASPVGSGAARSSANTKVKAAEAYTKFENTGSVDDWVRFRSAKLQKS